MAPDLVIRADANSQIGLGHVARCLALAEPWTKAGASVVLLTKSPSSATRERAEKIGVHVRELASGDDAKETASFDSRWVILDGYHFDSETQRILKEAGRRVLAFDDGGALDHYYADFILNQSFGATAEQYLNIESYSRLLLGPRFAQLRGEFTRLRGVHKTNPVAKKLLLTMGGSDPENATAQILTKLNEFDVTAIVGPENKHWEDLREKFPAVELVRNPSNLPELMAASDLAITAAGSTAWELAFLGVPFVAVVIAENQRPNAGSLEKAGLGKVAGIENAAEAAMALANDFESRRKMSQRQRAVFDGRGSLRVWLRMNENVLSLRNATESDGRLIWNWANDPVARAVSFSTEPIPWESHVEWFKRRLANASSRLWITENQEGLSIGQIRFDFGESSATLSISLDPEWRGKNLGPLLIWTGAKKLFAETEIDLINAYVKPENAASARAFEKADFRAVSNATVSGHEALHFELSRANVEP